MSEIASDMRTAAAAAETALGPLVGTGFLGSAPQIVGVVPAGSADAVVAGPIGPFTPLAGAGHELLLQGYTSGFGAVGLSTMTAQIETAPAIGGPWTPVGRTEVSGIPDTGLTVITSLEGSVTAYIHPAAGVPLFVRLAVTTVGGGGTYTTASAIEGTIGAQQL